MNLELFPQRGSCPLVEVISKSYSFQIESAKWLIDNGADVNASMPSTGWTAGHAAAKKDNLEMLELLLQKGANQNVLAMHRDFGKNLR